MKTLAILLTVLLAGFCQAELVYDYVIDSYGPTPSLRDSQTMLMIGDAGTGSLDLWDSSYARLDGTSPLKQGGGGVWVIGLAGSSRLEMLGGEVNTLSIGTHATAVLSGGSIREIDSTQYVWALMGQPPETVWTPHITMICDVESVVYNETTRRLTGNWLDGSAFNIQLLDRTAWGYDPAIENIRFIPEPGTLALLSLCGVLMRVRLTARS